MKKIKVMGKGRIKRRIALSLAIVLVMCSLPVYSIDLRAEEYGNGNGNSSSVSSGDGEVTGNDETSVSDGSITQVDTSISMNNVGNHLLGDTFQLSIDASRNFSLSEMSFTSDSYIATVDVSGNVTIADAFEDDSTEEANVNIRAKLCASEDGLYRESNEAVYSFMVSKNHQNPLPSYNKDLNLFVGQTRVYAASFAENATGAVSYSSNAPEIASVDAASGLVTAIAPGEAVITVRKSGDRSFLAEEASITVKVVSNVTKDDVITVTGTTGSVSDNNGRIWYQGDAGILAKEGYAVSLTDSGFTTENINIDTNTTETVKFYAFDTVNNAKTELMETENIYRDAIAPSLSVEQPAANRIYKDSAQFTINCSDELSGIQSLDYVAKLDGVEFENGSIDLERGSKTYNSTFASFADNDGRYELIFTATDFAGNVTTKNINYRVNTVLPVISVSMNDQYYVRDNASGLAFYNSERTATVTVLCDSECFNEDAAKEQLVLNAITVSDKDGSEMNLTGIDTSEWTHLPGDISANDRHELTVTFSEDGFYSWAPEYTDVVGNASNLVNYGDSADAEVFVIDTESPTGDVAISGQGLSTSLQEVLEYSCIVRSDAGITVNTNDNCSGIYDVSYYVPQRDAILSVVELDSLERNAWKKHSNGFLPNKGNFVYYVRIEDYAGNITYISSKGCIVDNTAPTVSLGGVDSSVHNGNVTVSINVEDRNANGTSSQIESVTYVVNNGKFNTDQGTLYSSQGGNVDINEVVASFAGSVVIDAAANNTNDTSITVYVTDRAGNTSSSSQSMKFDVVKPTISVVYDNNSGDTAYEDTVYFKAGRTARIEITERNFESSLVDIVAKNKEGVDPVISGWTTSGTGDSTVNVATVTFAADGKYEFSVSCKDLAGNASESTGYGNALAPNAFVVDKTLPGVSLSYDNNSVQNENYYNASRTATIRIDEHNFDPSRVIFTAQALDEGKTLTAPSLSNWTTSGDIHTATINFDVDAIYAWELSVSDKAGNVSQNSISERFCVDQTDPLIVLSGITNESVNTNEGNIGFELTGTDTNMASFVVNLTALVRSDKKFVRKEVEVNEESVKNGKLFSVDNLKEDGIYLLEYEAIDKAGNKSEETTVFSVNRDGSTFWLDDNSVDFVNNYYVKSIDTDIVIYEINADPLKNREIYVNGNKLSENSDYAVKEEHSDDTWYKYTYTINKSLFEAEGEYVVYVESKDKADRDAFSDIKGLEIAFDVDNTAPSITVTGLEEDGNYLTDAQKVTVMPLDDGGKVGSFIAKVFDREGNLLNVAFEMSGEELSEYLEAHNGTVEFSIPEGIRLTVEIICGDCAVSSDGKTNESVFTYKDVTVSSNGLVIFWAESKAGILTAGSVLIVGGGAFGNYMGRRKKRKL